MSRGYTQIVEVGRSPSLQLLPGGSVALRIDETLRDSVLFTDAEHLSEWLASACEGLNGLLEPDPCDGGGMPRSDDAPVVAP